MATSYNDVAVTSLWVDLTVANTALSAVPVLLQRKDNGDFPINVFFGGVSAPSQANAGVLLMGLADATDGTAAKIWVRADGAGGALYTALKDV